jgi:hypothetical protein
VNSTDAIHFSVKTDGMSQPMPVILADMRFLGAGLIEDIEMLAQ